MFFYESCIVFFLAKYEIEYILSSKCLIITCNPRILILPATDQFQYCPPPPPVLLTPTPLTFASHFPSSDQFCPNSKRQGTFHHEGLEFGILLLFYKVDFGAIYTYIFNLQIVRSIYLVDIPEFLPLIMKFASQTYPN